MFRVKYHYSDVSVRQYIILSGIVFSYAMLMNMFLDNIVIRWSLGIIILIVYSIVFQKVILDLLSKKEGEDNGLYYCRDWLQS